MENRINLDNITIVLHHPRFPENIGSVARCMRNMGISKLHVVSTEEINIERALTLATHAASDTIHAMKRFDDLKSAVADAGYVVGTTARLGKSRQRVKTPAKMAESLVPVSLENRVAVVFGPEDRGLTNDELRNCHELVTIRTAAFSSINLAQAVMIICYELFNAAADTNAVFLPKLALRPDLDAMYEQLKNMLVRISFIQPDNPEYWMDRFRRFFSRLPLQAVEVRIIRGICRQVDWYARKCYEDGKQGRLTDFMPPMDTTPGMNTVKIKMPEGDKNLFTVFSRYGFSVDVPAGASIRELLQKTLGLDADDIDNHIQTILHDGTPVDNIDSRKIASASAIALSGPLPGFFEAALRKGGRYAALPPREVQAENAAPSKNGVVTVTVKLFNLTARQLGPKLLEEGIPMSTESFRPLWKSILALDTDRSLRVFLDGNKTDPESLMGSIGSEQVLLLVHLRS